MTSLRSMLDLLLVLQDIDTQRDRQFRTLTNLTDGAAEKADADEARRVSTELRNQRDKLSVELKSAELDLAMIEGKLRTYQDRMKSGSITNAKELMNSEKEIEQFTRLRSAKDEAILAMMDQIDSVQVNVTEAEAVAADKEEKHRQALAQCVAKRESAIAKIKEVDTQRPTVVAQITDAQLLKTYEAIRARKNNGGIGIGKVVDGACSGCRMPVTTVDAGRAKAGEELMYCQSCGRILA